MKVKVKVFGLLREYCPKEEFQAALAGPMTVRELLTALQINPDLVMTVIINGKRQDKNYPLSGGEEMDLIPPLAGG